MTELEISKALALAIGWKPEQMHTHIYGTGWAVSVIRPDDECVLRIFDYRDWSVISPIAERFDCFPYQNYEGRWVSSCGLNTEAETPQKAIALAVIEGSWLVSVIEGSKK